MTLKEIFTVAGLSDSYFKLLKRHYYEVALNVGKYENDRIGKVVLQENLQMQASKLDKDVKSMIGKLTSSTKDKIAKLRSGYYHNEQQ